MAILPLVLGGKPTKADHGWDFDCDKPGDGVIGLIHGVDADYMAKFQCRVIQCDAVMIILLGYYTVLE